MAATASVSYKSRLWDTYAPFKLYINDSFQSFKWDSERTAIAAKTRQKKKVMAIEVPYGKASVLSSATYFLHIRPPYSMLAFLPPCHSLFNWGLNTCIYYEQSTQRLVWYIYIFCSYRILELMMHKTLYIRWIFVYGCVCMSACGVLSAPHIDSPFGRRFE